MTCLASTRSAPVPRRAGLPGWDTAAAIFKRWAALRAAWHARERERAFLATLEDFQLRDMGLTLEDRQREVSKPFWRE